MLVTVLYEAHLIESEKLYLGWSYRHSYTYIVTGIQPEHSRSMHIQKKLKASDILTLINYKASSLPIEQRLVVKRVHSDNTANNVKS